MSTLAMVAKTAGVSVTTASMVLNRTKQANRVSPECINRVKRAAKLHGYVPNYHARSMKLGRSYMIAAALDVGFIDEVVSERSELENGYFSHLLGGMELAARNQQYQFTIIGPDRRHRAPDRGLIGIRQRRFDGLIVVGLVVHTELTNFLTESHDVPIVVVESPQPTTFARVEFDHDAGVQCAVRHLYALNHRRLLFVHFGEGGFIARRCAAVFAEVQAAGMQCEKLFIPNVYGDLAGAVGLHIDAVEAGMLRYLAENKPFPVTAVVAFNDVVGVGVCSALQKAGIPVPQDVSVIGFDDIEARMCIPRLTTVSHRLPDMGRRASEILLGMIGDEDNRLRLRGTCEMVEPRLIVRASTGPVPRSKG